MTERQQSALDRLKRGINDIWFATLYSQEEMDEVYSLPYMRTWHPSI